MNIIKLRTHYRGVRSARKLVLNLYSDSPDFSKLRILPQSLKKMKTLYSLKIYFSFLRQLKDHSVREILNGFKGTKSLKMLSFEFQNCINVSSYAFEGLKNSFGCTAKELEVNFNFRDCSRKLDDSTLKHISRIVPRNKNITSLNLNILNCYQITEKGRKFLGKALHKANTLQSIKLNLKSPAEGSEQEFLLYAFYKLRPLKKLSIEYEKDSLLTDSMVSALGRALQMTPLLEIFKLKIPRASSLTARSLRYLTEGIKVTTSLKELGLDLSD